MDINCLVDDVLLGCFEEALLTQTRDYVKFVRARRDLVAVSRRFRDLVHGSTVFWSWIIITPRLPVDVVHAWASRVKETSADVTVDFSNASRFYRRGELSDRICSYFCHAVPGLVSGASCWSSLRILVMESACCGFFLEMVPPRRLSTLSRLELVCGSPPFDSTPLHSRMTLRSPVRSVQEGITSLSHLVLDSFGMDWDPIPALASLISLQLRGISRSDFLLVRHYNHVLLGATSLRHLVLRSSEWGPLLIVYGLAEQIVTGCLLPNVDTLELEFNGSHLLGYLVGTLLLPRLKRVVLHLDNLRLDGFLSAVRKGPSMFDVVVELALVGRIDAEEEWIIGAFPELLFSHFADLVDMDLSSVSPLIFCSLFDHTSEALTGNSELLLPHLKHLVVEGVDLSSLQLFAALRMFRPGHGLTCIRLNTSQPLQARQITFGITRIHVVYICDDAVAVELQYSEADDFEDLQ
ncbi:hypothetical protein C8J57DRAFT_1541942 [Mycena rebaudengoi]|nr:hypothetical protein C8J57DRAFT_1541942 [Mycena rebaudengoi]